MQRFSIQRAALGALLGYVAFVETAHAQHPMEHMMSDTATMHSMLAGPLGISMDRMGSGTTWIPDAVPLPMYHAMAGKWELMAHGTGFVQYDDQGSDRGNRQFGSTNWTMLMASRKVNDDLFQARAMISAEPATITSNGYPLLLQTGESNKGVALHDRQHPHDFLMELSALYQAHLTTQLGLELYAAPSGEPALGPVAYMHRPSALDNPVAPIGHHWQDATHITFGVLTTGIYGKRWKLEGSVFNGREPDDQRWDIDPIRLDSYSGRLTVNPDSQWSMTAGYGFLKSPEALHPDESIHRLVASLINARQLGHGQWATSLVWGANDISSNQGWTHTALFESEAILDRHNTVFGRLEFAQKSAEELVLPTTSFAANQRFNVGNLSLGYIRDVIEMLGATGGFGVMGTVNRVPADLTPIYGTRSPLGGLVFFRVRPAYTPLNALMSGMPQHR